MTAISCSAASPLRAPGVLVLGIHQVRADVILDDLCRQARQCSTGAGKQMHHLLALSLAVQRSFDGFYLPSDTADPSQELLLVAYGMSHGSPLA